MKQDKEPDGADFDVKDCAIRLAERDDVAYMFTRALADLRNWVLVHGTPDGIYHQYTHRALEYTFMRAPILIAYPAPKNVRMEGSTMVRHGNPRKILGFLVADPTEIGLVVHYMNVRRSQDDKGHITQNYRRKGIATKLLQTAIEQFKVRDDRIYWTLKTSMFRYHKEFRQKIFEDKRFVYNPFLFFTLLPDGWETGIRKPSAQHMAHIPVYD